MVSTFSCNPTYCDRLKTVTLSGNLDTDSGVLKAAASTSAGADTYLDLSPDAAGESTHIGAAIKAVKHRGFVRFMGGIMGRVSIPYDVVMYGNLEIRGRMV